MITYTNDQPQNKKQIFFEEESEPANLQQSVIHLYDTLTAFFTIISNGASL